MAERNKRQSGAEGQARWLILIVEDNTNIGSVILQAIATDPRYQAILVHDGAQALDLIEHIIPQLLLLDYRLPDFTGIDLYERLRAYAGLEYIPMILMSADPLAASLARKLGLPYLKKPFKLVTLFALLASLLEHAD